MYLRDLPRLIHKNGLDYCYPLDMKFNIYSLIGTVHLGFFRVRNHCAGVLSLDVTSSGCRSRCTSVRYGYATARDHQVLSEVQA